MAKHYGEDNKNANPKKSVSYNFHLTKMIKIDKNLNNSRQTTGLTRDITLTPDRVEVYIWSLNVSLNLNCNDEFILHGREPIHGDSYPTFLFGYCFCCN